MPSMVIPLVFGYLNLVLVPELLNLYKKGSPLSINLVLGGSFLLTLLITIVLAVALFLITGTPITGKLFESPELNLITPFSLYGPWGAWLIGGFLYIWWRTSEFYTPADSTSEKRTSSTPYAAKKKMALERIRDHSIDGIGTWGQGKKEDKRLDKITPEVQTSNVSFFLKDDLPTCAICKSKIKSDQETTSCPGCSTNFHLTHFAEWVRQKGTCPICNERIGIQ